jgi:hypothetical protein
MSHMAHGHFQDPDFDDKLFRSALSEWSAAGAMQLNIEWQTGPGPTLVWYPAGERKVGGVWRFEVAPTQYNEQYADYLELRAVPRLSEIARESGFQVRARCVDQQPIQVMRMRRRELEHAERASS